MTMDPRELEDTYTLPTLPGGARLPFDVMGGEGCYVTDGSGRKFLDLYGGHAVCSIGHSHPRWLEALSRQARELSFYSTVTYHPQRAEAARLVVENCYSNMKKVFFCNSGAEANETALKLARKSTGRSKIVSMQRAFHGRTLGALSVTGGAGYRAAFPDNISEKTVFLDLGDLKGLQGLPAEEIAGVILEPIQSVAGVFAAPADYYRGVRDFCDANDIRLIFDEVQTGVGRTGKWYVGEHWDVEPDIVSSAKGVAGGFPAGVVVVNGEIADGVAPADHASTFGGGPLASACIAATHQVLLDEGLVSRVAQLSNVAIDRLRGLSGLVSEVRGMGYLLGIECSRPAKEVQMRLMERGILVGTSGQPDTIRLLPPLTLTVEEWETFFAAMEDLAAS